MLESPKTRELFYPWNFPALVSRQLDTYNAMYGSVEPPAWATSNKVVLEYPNPQNPIMRLRDFSNADSDPEKTLLVVAPNAGHASTIIDYKASQSLVGAGLKEGYSVYGTEWVSPTEDTKNTTMDDYVEALEAGLDYATDEGRKEAVLEGNCQGGWLSTVVAARNAENIRHLILAGAPIDFLAGNGPIKQYAQLFPMSFYEGMVADGDGVMPGKYMLLGFQNLDPVEQFIKKPFDVFEKLGDPAFEERTAHYEKWWRTTQDLPGPYYLRTVHDLFKENKLVKGELAIQTKRDKKPELVDMKNINCPITLVWGTKDIITTWEQMIGIRSHVSTPADQIEEVIMEGKGHIGTFMSGDAIRNVYPAIFRKSRIWTVANTIKKDSEKPDIDVANPAQVLATIMTEASEVSIPNLVG